MRTLIHNTIAIMLLILVQQNLIYGQYDDNPFLNGYTNDAAAVAGIYSDQQQNYDMDLANNPFLSHMISSRAIPGFAGPQYLPPNEKQKLICNGNQYCVNANSCSGGYFTQGSPSRQDCDSDTEVCCTYRPPPPPPPPTSPPRVPAQCPPGGNYACVPQSACQNGVVSGPQSGASASSSCYSPNVCCRIPQSTNLGKDGYVLRVPDKPLPIPTRPQPTQPRPTQPRPTQPRPTQPRYVPPTAAPSYLPPKKPPQRGEDQLSYPIIKGEQSLPSACAAAMNCTDIQFCDATGFISKTPVILTKDQEAFRVPLTDCRDSAKGIVGKCCRDPDYTDPWPVSQLGRYDPAIFGGGQYNKAANQRRSSYTPSKTNNKRQSTSASVKNQIVAQPTKFKGQCGTRNYNSSPQGSSSIEASFGEYPWQTMVLLDSTKSLLCGGVIVSDNIVATTANCVRGKKSFDVVVKGGEWKLGSDEEPLKFQLIRVRRIELHPQNDLALLLLDTKFKLNWHISPICLDDSPAVSDDCVTTGWGKEALRVHLQDAVMHHSQVSMYPSEEPSNIIYGQTVNDACELDPGSALACKNSQGQYVLKGVYSKEESCGSSIVGFATPDLKWINSIMSGKKPSYNQPKSTNNYAYQQPQIQLQPQPQPQVQVQVPEEQQYYDLAPAASDNQAVYSQQEVNYPKPGSYGISSYYPQQYAPSYAEY